MNKRGFPALAVCIIAFTAMPGILFGQRDRLAGLQVDRRSSVTLSGHIYPAATAANDQGRADAAMQMPNLSLMLKPSAEQQKALEDLLARQQDPSSPDYRNWLTPDEYADRFGVSPTDLAKITSWLQSEGFTVISTARGRNSITFKGSASRAETAFHTQIRRYIVRGEMHYANAADPSVPSALSGLVGEIRGLHDFRPRARARLLTPHYTSASGRHYIAPDDVATIYDYQTLYSQGIDGGGQKPQKVVIVGQTRIDLTDIQKFRALFNLPPSDPTTILVPGLLDPGIRQGDLGEADLDIETVGAVARGATVIFVYSNNVDDAITYAINQNLAPVLSSSYGLCEALSGRFFTKSQQTLAQQATAQGITWVTASGDSGANDCYSDTAGTASGLSVDEPGSIPEVTSVGGTEFNEGSGNYWNSSNDVNHASALSYIPEMAWNDSVSDGSPSASGGGASLFFAKPSWQTGRGVPNDGARDVPDVSFSSSANHDGYMIVTGGSQAVFGGTSVAAPLFGGMLALLNQYQVVNGFQKGAGLGNINPKLYALAASSPSVFHDITTGDNKVDPCGPSARGCTAGSTIGFNATPGYDQATGLGSIDFNNLVLAWNGNRAVSTLSLSFTIQGANLVLTSVVAGSASPTPSGIVSWALAGSALNSSSLALVNGKATAILSIPVNQLPGGSFSLSAVYAGDPNFNAASGSLAVTLPKAAPGVSVTANTPTISQNGSVNLTAVVTGPTSSTPTGTVTWSQGAKSLGVTTLTGAVGRSTTTLTVNGSQFSVGTATVQALYSGDTAFNSGSATQTVTVAPGSTPAITSGAAIVSAASFQAGIAANSWIAITGNNLSAGIDTWANAVGANGQLPTSLGGVSVSVAGKPAYIYYVSPTQIDVLAPNITAGSVNITVTTALGTSAPVTATAIALQPAFFQWGIYAVATRPDYTYAVKNGVLSVPTAPAKPGDVIILWGTSFGQADPAAPVGFVTPSDKVYNTANPVTVTVGGSPVQVLGAALTPGAAGLYQVAIQLPTTLANNDYQVVATVAGAQSPSTTMLTVHN